MNVKKIGLSILLVIIIAVGIILGVNTNNNKEEKISDKLQVVVSNFASYDFIRAIIGDTDDVELTFLLGAGKDAHSYDPTAGDLIKIQNADLFVYVGGEMEGWHEKVLESIDTTNKKVICIADSVETIDEKDIDGAEHAHEDEDEDHDHENEAEDHEEHEHGFDEHIWTSPKNAIAMISALEKAMEEINPSKSDIYKQNCDKYIEQINEVDKEIQDIVDNKVRDRLVFGDKMPMQYFIEYYNLDVSAAFSGCSTETEPSSKTIAYLVNKVKEENIPVVLYVELNDGKVAKTIANEVGNNVQAMQIQSLHNVTKKDFDNGETWVTLMKSNVDVLRKALQ